MAKQRPIIDVETTPELNKLMGAYYVAIEALVEAAAAEDAARMAVFNHFYPEDTPENIAKRLEPGAELFGFPGGWVLEIQRRQNVTVDEASVQSVKAEVEALPPDAQTGEIPNIDAAIQFKPKLSESKFKELPDYVQAIVKKCLTFNPGKPALKLEYRASRATKAQAVEGSEHLKVTE